MYNMNQHVDYELLQSSCWKQQMMPKNRINCISPDKARKGVIYPLKTGIYALVGISKRTFTRLISKQRGKIRPN